MVVLEHLTILVWTVLIVSLSSEEIKGTMSDARIITNVLEKMLTPYIKNNQLIDGKRKQNTIFVPKITSIDIEKAIKQRVKELKPLLQDSDNHNTAKRRTKNNFKIERSDETTIIENKRRTMSKLDFRQTKQSIDTFEKKIENYKQLRQNITKLLDKVNVASSAKKLITRSLDEMLDLLRKRQCKLNSVDITNILKHLVKSPRKSMPGLTNIGLKMLREMPPFNELEFYDKTGNISEISDEIFLQLLLPISKLIDKYKLRCIFDRKENDTTKDQPMVLPLFASYPRTSIDLDNNAKDPCESFIICTEELTDFLKVTYDTLKITATSTFRNYIDMYVRDIKHETVYTSDTVTTKLDALGNVTETKVKEIFVNELKSFMLDNNKRKTANIVFINHFITATTNKTNSRLKSHLDREMSALKNSTFITIKDDLTVNLRQDMDNLRDLFSTKICSFFVRCNSIPSRTRRFRNVYVKVQRSFADELKDSLQKDSFEQNLKSLRRDIMTSRSGNSVFYAINRRKYGYGNVTRTSIRTTITTKGVISSSENMLKEHLFF